MGPSYCSGVMMVVDKSCTSPGSVMACHKYVIFSKLSSLGLSRIIDWNLSQKTAHFSTSPLNLGTSSLGSLMCTLEEELSVELAWLASKGEGLVSVESRSSKRLLKILTELVMV